MKKRRLFALLLAAVLLLAGCGGEKTVSDRVGDAAGSPEPTAPTQPAPAASPDALRQEMAGAGQLFAVAYLGYHFSQDAEIPVDPIAVMAEYAPELCAELPFLAQIPAGDGYPVDDSFPVLMLDGELWIGRNGSGLGLPHFYADTLADVLVRPAG